MDLVIKPEYFHSRQNTLRCEFDMSNVDMFYSDYLTFLQTMPEAEKNKYSTFMKNDKLKLCYLNIYKEKNLFNFQFNGPDITSSGPKAEYYKSIVDTNTYSYANLSANYFKNTANYLEQHPEYIKATIMIYKPGSLVMPHTHSEYAVKVLITHTLLHDIKSGEFNFWCENAYIEVKEKGSTFDFEGKYAHYAASSDHAVFLEVDKLK